MKLVIDLQSAQGQSGQRGIGRQSVSLAKALAADSRGHEVWILLSGLFPDTIEPLRNKLQPWISPERIVVMDLTGPVAWRHPASARMRLQAENERQKILSSLRPDAVLLSSLFEGLADESVTSLAAGDPGYLQVVSLHDLMPLIHPQIFLNSPLLRAWYAEKLGHLSHAGLFLAISESSRNEGIQQMNLPPGRVVSISCAADALFRPRSYTERERCCLLGKFGITRPYVMFCGGDSPQKNIETLLRAYASLPPELRKQFQLAVVCGIESRRRSALQQLATQLGLEDANVVFTGYVRDEELAAFYQFSSLFVFPSWHEGFGLPVLEAMSCGAAVIGSNTTSIPEVLGLSDAMFDPHDVPSLSLLLQRALQDPAFRERLVAHGLARAAQFSWAASALLAWQALESATGMPAAPSASSGPAVPPHPGEKSALIAAPLVPEVNYQLRTPHSFGPYLGPGWSARESWGAWTDGPEASLFFEVTAPDGQSIVLKLRGRAFVNPRLLWKRIKISVNGRQVRDFLFFFPCPVRNLSVPLGPADAEGFYRVALSIHPVCSPASIGQNADDHRQLGFALKGLRLDHPVRSVSLAGIWHWLLHRRGPTARLVASMALPEAMRDDLRQLALRGTRTCTSPSRPKVRTGAVSVVICTLNRAAMLEQTLRGLEQLTGPEFEVVVVNGPSRDGTAGVLEGRRGRIKVAQTDLANLSVSRNIGWSMAAGEFIAYLDDDAVPDPLWLIQVLQGFDHAGVGAAGGKVLDRTGKSFQYEYASSDRLGRSNWLLKAACSERNYPGSYRFPYLQGTNAVFRRSVLSELGGFDENYAYYLDETELCLRVNDAGFVIRQLPGAWVTHHNASSDLRQDDVIVDHGPILFSKIYFANRHGRFFHSQSEIDEECRRFVTDHRNGIAHHLQAGRVDARLAREFDTRAELCWRKALEAADLPPRLAVRSGPVLEPAPFLNYRL
ncbi:MAG: glycosyltransferase [Candidatus Methylacidiphilales bacterium]|nr:glycosyltransferase [Candidatus Methylacidiphilales bacterium]